VTLLGEGSLRALERESGLKSIDPRRFRMLIQFSSGEEHVEDTWRGAELKVGSARLRVGGPVARCTAITRDPERGVRDAALVKAIKEYRGMCPTDTIVGVPFGVYARVLEGGRVRVGDPLEVGRPEPRLM
jgi:uncharacterized protein YcbX